DGEATFPLPVSIITLLHPPTVVPAGSFDPSFKPIPAMDGNIAVIERTPEFIYLAGRVPDENHEIKPLLRLRHDGSVDASYKPALSMNVLKLLAVADGKLMVAGQLQNGLFSLVRLE